MKLARSLDELQGLRAARWVRESTRGQYDSFGPDAQREQQDRAIERHGLIDSGLSWTVAHSGRTVGNTEQFRDMLARAGTEYDILVVGYVSRFARDLRTAVNARHELHQRGAALLFADERLLSSDEDGWEQWARETVEAEAYSHRLAKRIREGYAAKFRRLGDQGGNAPLGFRRDGPARTLVVDPLTIGKVVEAFEAYATGVLSYEKVGDQVELHPDQVRAMLVNPIYNGWSRRYRRSGREQRQATPWRTNPPVSDDLWERVQAVRRRRYHGVPQPKRGTDPLGGLLYCACGRRVRSNGTAGTPPRRQRLHPGSCELWGQHRTTWGTTHDDPISAQIEGIRLDDATIERVVRVLVTPEVRPTSIDKARLERRKRELALDHAAGRLTDDDYLDNMRRLREAEPPPSAAEPNVAAVGAVAALRSLSALWSTASVSDEARAEFLRAVYDRITVTRKGFVSVELTDHARAIGLDQALPETVVARPAGVGPVRAVRIPITGRRERWVAARRSA